MAKKRLKQLPKGFCVFEVSLKSRARSKQPSRLITFNDSDALRRDRASTSYELYCNQSAVHFGKNNFNRLCCNLPSLFDFLLNIVPLKQGGFENRRHQHHPWFIYLFSRCIHGVQQSNSNLRKVKLKSDPQLNKRGI